MRENDEAAKDSILHPRALCFHASLLERCFWLIIIVGWGRFNFEIVWRIEDTNLISESWFCFDLETLIQLHNRKATDCGAKLADGRFSLWRPFQELQVWIRVEKWYKDGWQLGIGLFLLFPFFVMYSLTCVQKAPRFTIFFFAKYKIILPFPWHHVTTARYLKIYSFLEQTSLCRRLTGVAKE